MVMKLKRCFLVPLKVDRKSCASTQFHTSPRGLNIVGIVGVLLGSKIVLKRKAVEDGV